MDFLESIENLKNCSCKRVHEFTTKIEISEGAINKVGSVLKAANFPKNICVVGDNNTFSVSTGLLDVLASSGIKTSVVTFDNLRIADMETSLKLKERIGNAEGVLAVGTGSVSDVCRMASHKLGIPYAIFATAPSMDGFASSNCPMIDSGYKRSYFVSAPAAVIADTKILADSPLILKAAGLADVLGKFIALADWKIAHLLTGEYFCENIAALVEQSANMALSLCNDIEHCTPSMAGKLMEALVLPGLAMAFCGSSRPASGAEHYLSHCWEVLFIRDGRAPEFHGAKVGVATILMADIYKRLAEIENPEFKSCDIDWKPVENYYKERIYTEIEKDFLIDPVKTMDPSLLKNNWKEISAILKQIPDAKILRDAIKKAGGATTHTEVNVDAELFCDTLYYCRYIRNRLTTYRLMDLITLPDDFIYNKEIN